MERARARPIGATDIERFALAFDNRIARYKLKGTHVGALQLPLAAQHNGLAYSDEDSHRVFTQIPYHFKEEGSEKYAMLVGNSVAVFQAHQGFCYSLIFASKEIWPNLPGVYSFAAAALESTGNWILESIPNAKFSAEASVFSL
jgi:hypothetical protein